MLLVGIDRNRGVTVRVRKKPEDQDQVHDVLERKNKGVIFIYDFRFAIYHCH